MDQDVEAEAGQDGVLELWILIHDDGDDADVGQESPGPAHHVLPLQPVLSGRVQASVVDGVVVALGQELDAAVLLLVQLEHPVHEQDKISAFQDIPSEVSKLIGDKGSHIVFYNGVCGLWHKASFLSLYHA